MSQEKSQEIQGTFRNPNFLKKSQIMYKQTFTSKNSLKWITVNNKLISKKIYD